MSDTTNLSLPLLSPSQAQKTVTVNEALARLDGLVQLVLVSRSAATPPVSAPEGACYGVPGGAVNDWAGQDGRLAVFVNGGWAFVTPRRGWRAFVADENALALHDGSAWQPGALALSSSGAATFARIDKFTHAIATGPTSMTSYQTPDGSMVIAVTARVLATISGSLTGWQLGNVGAEDRFGTGLGLPVGSYARGMLSAPLTYYGATSLVLTAQGGSFSGGTVRFAVHYLDLGLPGL